MTGLMYNKPDDPLEFVQRAIVHIQNETSKVKWDMFIENPPPVLTKQEIKKSNFLETTKHFLVFPIIFLFVVMPGV